MLGSNRLAAIIGADTAHRDSQSHGPNNPLFVHSICNYGDRHSIPTEGQQNTFIKSPSGHEVINTTVHWS